MCQSDIDPELAEAGVPVSEDAVPNNRGVIKRQQSTMGITGIASVLEKAMNERGMDQETKGELLCCISFQIFNAHMICLLFFIHPLTSSPFERFGIGLCQGY